MRLTQRINAALLIIGIIPLALLTIYALGWFQDSVRQHSRQALSSLAMQVGREVSRSLRDGSGALDFLGRHPALLDPDTPEYVLKSALSDLLSFHPILKDISVLDPSSRVRASAKYSFRGEWTRNPWFRKALNGERVISDAHAMLYPLDVVMTMAQPLRAKDTSISGVLVGQFDLGGFSQIVDTVASELDKCHSTEDEVIRAGEDPWHQSGQAWPHLALDLLFHTFSDYLQPQMVSHELAVDDFAEIDTLAEGVKEDFAEIVDFVAVNLGEDISVTQAERVWSTARYDVVQQYPSPIGIESIIISQPGEHCLHNVEPVGNPVLRAQNRRELLDQIHRYEVKIGRAHV